MNECNMDQKLIDTSKQLYKKASSSVLVHDTMGNWFHTSVGVCQGCHLSPTLFNLLLERIMTEALEEHYGTVSIGGRLITNLRLADCTDRLVEKKKLELANLVNSVDKTSARYSMGISAEKTKLMSNEIAHSP